MIKETDSPLGNTVLPPGTQLPKTAEQLRKEKAEAKKAKKAQEKAKRKGMPMTLLVRHDFSERELVDLGKQLNSKYTTQGELEAQKKAVMKDYGSRIETCKAEAGGISNKLSEGYEMRPQDVLVFFNPKEKKRYVFSQAGKYIRTEDMQPGDFQTQLFPELGKSYEEGADLTKQQLKAATTEAKPSEAK